MKLNSCHFGSKAAFIAPLTLFLGSSYASAITFQDVTQPGDPVMAVNGFGNPQGGGPNDPNEGASKSIDDVNTDKYLNFDKEGSGLIVTPAVGPTVVTGLELVTANDNPARDPASTSIDGSTDGGLNWSHIVTLLTPLPDARSTAADFTFANSTAYASYRITFPTLKNTDVANSVQIAEIALPGSTPNAVPEPSSLMLLVIASSGLIRRCRIH